MSLVDTHHNHIELVVDNTVVEVAVEGVVVEHSIAVSVEPRQGVEVK